MTISFYVTVYLSNNLSIITLFSFFLFSFYYTIVSSSTLVSILLHVLIFNYLPHIHNSPLCSFAIGLSLIHLSFFSLLPYLFTPSFPFFFPSITSYPFLLSYLLFLSVYIYTLISCTPHRPFLLSSSLSSPILFSLPSSLSVAIPFFPLQVTGPSFFSHHFPVLSSSPLPPTALFSVPRATCRSCDILTSGVIVSPRSRCRRISKLNQAREIKINPTSE